MAYRGDRRMSKAPNRKYSKAAPGKRGTKGDAPLQIKRHCEMLSPKETDELVESPAGMIVEFIKAGGKVPASGKGKRARSLAGRDEPAYRC